MHDETAESFFVEITELESLAERFQMNLEGVPVLEGGCSPLIKYAIFFYRRTLRSFSFSEKCSLIFIIRLLILREGMPLEFV